MKAIEIVMWYKCNCRCRFCFVPESVREDRFTSREVRELLEWGRAQGAESVYFGGGEPTIRKDLRGHIRFAREIGYAKVHLKTNGMLLCYPELAKNYIGDGATDFSIPVWGPTPSEHDALSQVPGSFERTEMGIKNVLDAGAALQLDILISAVTLPKLADMVRTFHGIGVRRFTLWYLSLFGMEAAGEAGDMATYVPRYSDAAPAAEAAFRAGRELGASITTSHIPPCMMRDSLEHHETVAALDLLVIAPGIRFKGEDSPFEGGPKVAACEACALSPVCLGVRADYLKVYGEEEFRAVK